MSSENLQTQDEEREVLLSIYDGDPAFKELGKNKYQYKYGEDNEMKSFLIEIEWQDTYPTEVPIINMDTFYNKHLKEPVKQKIKEFLLNEAKQNLDMPMTYTLFEVIKEKVEELLENQPETVIQEITNDIENIEISNDNEVSKKLPKKEQLTKAQKRRAWDRADAGKGGDRERGWNWVDIVKHLSQTGNKTSDDNVFVPRAKQDEPLCFITQSLCLNWNSFIYLQKFISKSPLAQELFVLNDFYKK